MSNLCHKRLVPLIAVLGMVTCDLLGVGAGVASAGTNGQKINYYSRYAYIQCTTGENQHSETVRSCTQLRVGSNLDPNYLWVGRVRINWYYTNNTYSPTDCDVPKVKTDGDYITCYDPTYP
jgi:hypothetical protein